jgi:hypothetical protein
MKHHFRNVVFALFFVFILLLTTVIGLEIGVPMVWGKWWVSLNLVGNPDHRMTTEQYDDVNSDAIRSAYESSDYREEDFNVIVLGDSFVYGMFLGRQDTIPYRLEQIAKASGQPNVRFINFGWISSSPYLSLRLLKDIGSKYKPDLVIEIVDMTDGWDDTFYQNAVEQKGFFKVARHMPVAAFLLGKWGREVVRKEWFSQALWGVPWQHYFPMERPLAETRSYLDVNVRNLDETYRYTHDDLHARFAAFVMPRSAQYSTRETPDDKSDEYTRLGPYSLEPFRYFAEVAPARAYPLIPLLEDFKASTVFPLTFAHDPHLSSEGNKEGARFIWQHLQEHHLLPEAATTTP